MLQPIRRLLIANRGEIACRIARTARAQGIVTVAVYTDVDARALHVAACDEAVYLGEEGHGSPYLNIAAVVAAAKTAKVDAVHPGFGFLSERADFAQAILDADLVWVGPPPTAMLAVGRKDAAKRLARLLGVPVVPGIEADGQWPSDAIERMVHVHKLAERAEHLPLPLLIKAVAGGGGRGMRIVRDKREMTEQLDLAAREAHASFGDATLLIEHFVEKGRHIEVQILADSHGHAVHLGERECSIQRRHQKIIEESPSPRVDPPLRERLGAAALAIARGVGYVGAGTVEFLLDDETGEFFFLEVNARIQVEHPVTEMVTGLDIVALQLDVATGAPLPLTQRDVQFSGHAIEARICAEDSYRDFVPQAGPVYLWIPPDLPHVRVDHGLWPCDTVPLHYDAMVAKVIAWGPDRPTAIARLQAALGQLRLCGVTINRPYLLQVLAHPEFAAGQIDTHWVGRNGPVPQEPAPSDGQLLAAALWLHGESLRRRFRNNPWRPDVTLLAQPGHAPAAVLLENVGAGDFRWAVERSPDPLLAKLPATSGSARLIARAPARLSTDGVTQGHVEVVVDSRRADWKILHVGPQLWLQDSAGTQVCLVEHGLLPEAIAAEQDKGSVVAPSAAVVTQVWATVGQQVAADDPLIAMEAMKMLTVLRAPQAAWVRAVYAQVGDSVAAGTPLVELSAQPPQAEA